MKTLKQTKHPAPDFQHRIPNGGMSIVLPLDVGCFSFRCLGLGKAWLMILLVACLCRPVFAADVPPASSSAISSAQQGRLDAMKAKGPNASLTILPVMTAGRPFDRVTDVLGVILEQRGLQHIEIARTPFIGGVKAEMPVFSAALAAFLKTNSITTEYALYAEFNGPSLDEARAVVADKSGEIVWTDHQTTQDKAFQALGTPRDPMMLIVFLVERLSPQLDLNEETAKKRSHKLEEQFGANSGYAPASERKERMPARLKTMKESRQKATLMVMGVRIGHAVNVTNASDLARRIGEAKLFQSAVAAKQSVLLEANMTGGDQMKYLWDIAREFQAYLKKNPPDADYVLYADYIFNRQHWQQGGVQFVVCDRQGEWVMAELSNSDQEDYQRIKPISAEGCDKLLVERLAGFIAVRLPGGQTRAQAESIDGHWEADIAGSSPQRNRVTLDLAKNAKSQWIASMGLPSASKTGMVAKDLVVNGKSVKFVAVELRMAAFDLTLRPDGTLQGTMSGPTAQPVEFKRTGDAKVELMATSPAVSKELEGDWQGTLESPNGSFRMAFHFKNNPDQTVAATMDSNDYKNMPLNDVKQTGQKVEFGIKIAGEARFEGSLNKEGTELAGELIHDATGVPLMLRKKLDPPIEL